MQDLRTHKPCKENATHLSSQYSIQDFLDTKFIQ